MKHRSSFNLKATQSIIKDTMKEYSGTSRDALLKYIVKQGNVFQSSKPIAKNATVKHLIVSSIHPKSYSKLDETQQIAVQKATSQWAMERFNDYPFIGGIELNENKGVYNQEYLGGIREGFHAHIAIAGFKVRGSIDIHALKENLTSYIAEHSDEPTRKILGIKNKSEIEELRRAKISRSKRSNALEALSTNPDFIQTNSEIQGLQSDLCDVFDSLNVQYSAKSNLQSLDKRQRYALIHSKEGLKEEIGYVKQSISRRKNEMTFIDRLISHDKQKMGSAEKFFNDEIQHLQNFYKKENLGYNYWADGEHALFKKIARERVKKQSISPAQFLYEVANNQSFWAYCKSDNRKKHELIINQRRQEFRKRLMDMSTLIQNLGRDRMAVVAIASMDRKKLEKKLAQYSDIGKTYSNHYEVFLKRMDTITKYIAVLKSKKVDLAQKKTMKMADKRTMIQKVLAFDAQHCSSKAFESLNKGIQDKYGITVSHGKEKKTDIDVSNKSVHISDKKSPSVLDDLIRGIVRITSIRESSILKSLNVKALLKVIKEHVYKTHPNYKEALESTDTIEGFVSMFDTLRSMSKTKPKIEEYQGFEM